MKPAEFMPKPDVRDLIKVTRTQNKRIDHPHARYNQLGRISCIVCGIQIKSEHAWNAHILSKTHKQNETRDLSGPLKRPIGTTPADSATVSCTDAKLARPSLTSAADPTKGLKANDTATASGMNNGLVADERNPAEKARTVEFDSKLPEGFFDDRYKDAKARNVPYKDKMTEEVELFQKELVALEKQSDEILEKETEAMVSRRELDEIDTQMKKWEKIQALEMEKETLEHKIKSKWKPVEPPRTTGPLMQRIKADPSDSEENTDDDSPADLQLYNFRAKNAI